MLAGIKRVEGLTIPSEELFLLPETILQFGTGVLLRGLPDYFIDKANKQGILGSRIVLVKSTGQGDASVFARQNNLYTQCIRGIENGVCVDEAVINASISRVLTADKQWHEILSCAASHHLKIIISNTTEVGIVLHNNDDVYAQPPVSFPGKLLAFLLERYKRFNGSAASGLVIIATELIPGNGKKLKSIVIELAGQNHLEKSFVEWLDNANDFCNSLVDRIVPGRPSEAEKAFIENRFGYTDELMIVSEPYRLWAIETQDKRTIDILSFSKADKGMVVTGNIDTFRELKLRLLNGSHTFCCALALQMGFGTVKQAMTDKVFYYFIQGLMLQEIVPAIVNDTITEDAATGFAASVLDRYSNPYIEHQWLSIALQYSSKMKTRNVPALQQYYHKMRIAPRYMALGFAAYLLFMKSEKNKEHAFTGFAGGRGYGINDDRAADLYQLWHNSNTNNFVEKVLGDISLWGADLDALPGFRTAVTTAVESIQRNGITQTVQNLLSGQTL